jgi:glycerate 2-kinase
MAEAYEAAWLARAHGPLSGLVVTRQGNARPTQSIEVAEASHPVPDAASLMAARRTLALLEGLTMDDLVVALISGGGSSLLTLPAGGLTLEDKQAVNRALLARGVPIVHMNGLRKHLSLVKGGRLAAAAHPARVVTLVVSDIPGDDPALVASGPTIPDPASRAEAIATVETYGLVLPPKALAWLGDPRSAAPQPDDPSFVKDEVHVVASAQQSLAAAAAAARQAGWNAAVLSDRLEGESREVAAAHARLVRHIAAGNSTFQRPIVLLSGGETTVTIARKPGRGGRNSEFALALALGIEGCEGVYALAADTDGIDGSEDNAGAFADGKTVARLRAAGRNPAMDLDGHDSYSAFAAIDDLFVSGPTATNVNDFRVILVESGCRYRAALKVLAACKVRSPTTVQRGIGCGRLWTSDPVGQNNRVCQRLRASNYSAGPESSTPFRTLILNIDASGHLRA